MTAIAIARGTDGVVVASDGAAYLPDNGVLVSHDTKVVLAPEWSCVFAQRGAGGIARAVRANLAAYPIRDLDGVLAALPAAAVAAYTNYVSQGYPWEPHFSLYATGWSESRQAFEIHVIRSRSREVTALGGGIIRNEPFVTSKIDGMVLAPSPQDAAARRCGLDMGAVWAGTVGMPPHEVAIRAVCAARYSPNEPEDAGQDHAEHGVGAFVQLTFLTQWSVQSSIVHRWADPIGEKIDPSRGDAVPSFLAAPAV